MHILFLSRWFPYPPDNGSKIRVWNLIKSLSTRHEVDLISFASEAVSQEQLGAMRRYCQHVSVVPYRPFRPTRFKAILGFFSPLPRSVIDTHSAEFQRLVEQTVQTHRPDLVIASEVDMAPYAMSARAIPKIFEEVELTVLYEQFVRQYRAIKKLRCGLTWWKTSHYVARLLRGFDGCTVVSDQERQRVLEVLPGYGPIQVVPNGVDTTCYSISNLMPAADTLIYSGALTYSANLDAVAFFLREVFPLVLAQRPNVKLYITGKLDGVQINQLPINDNVVFTGYLDDIRPALARAWVSVVPLRIGGGTRLKILESLALGTPVVSTSKGAEGLDLLPGRDLLIADNPADLAAAVLRVLQSAELRTFLGRNGRRAVEVQYDWASIGQRLNDFVERVAREACPARASR